MENEKRPYASSACMMHDVWPSPDRPARFRPGRPLPPYAYLPGRFPHPVRDSDGHSYGEEGAPAAEPLLTSDSYLWGVDLFNNGFYWEAHEAWEPLWRAAGAADPRRLLLKGLILLAASGVKIREGKRVASAKHASRAAALFHKVQEAAPDLASALGMSPARLVRHAKCVADAKGGRYSGLAERVFEFVLVPALRD